MFFKKHAQRIALYNYKKQHTCKGVDSIVVNKLRHKKIFNSIELFEVAIRSKILFHNIVLPFRLFIDLKIKNDEKIFNDL